METVTASHASERCFQTCTRLSSRVVKKHANDVVTWLNLPVVSADHVSASINARHVQRCAHPRTLRYVSIATTPLHCGAGIVSMVTRLPSSSVDNVEKKLANVVVTSLNLQAVCASNVSASRVDVHTATDLSKLAQHKGKSVLNLSVRGPLRCATCACSPTRILGIDAKYAGGSGVRCALCVTTTGRELIRGFSLVADRASTSGTVQNVRSRTPPVAYLNAPCARRIRRFGLTQA